MKLNGKIINILANFYYVQDSSNKIWECFARNRMLKEGKLLSVGDFLEFEITGTDQGVIVNAFPPKNRISKPPVSNIDQVMIVFSGVQPELDLYNLDRYLSFIDCELPDIEKIICINKIDLKEINIDEVYINSKLNIFYVSAKNGSGLNDLSRVLFNKTTVLAGPSGAGKSSLIKALAPNENIRIGDLSSINKGRHTTRNVQLITINLNSESGYLVDTPGFSQFNFGGLNPTKILKSFKEFDNIQCEFSNCLFDNCLRDGKNGCLIKDPKDFERINTSRFENYLKILDEAKSEVNFGSKRESKSKITGGISKGKGKHIPKIEKIKRAKSRKREKQEIKNLNTEFDIDD